MVTSWNWVLLTDFASFKPTYLPEVKHSSINFVMRVHLLTFSIVTVMLAIVFTL